MKPFSDIQIFLDASHKAASRTRFEFLFGRMTEEEFFAKRARQDAANDRRFDQLMTRRFPNHKPQEPRK